MAVFKDFTIWFIILIIGFVLAALSDRACNKRWEQKCVENGYGAYIGNKFYFLKKE